MRFLAERLIDHAARVLSPLRPVQAQAMRAELAYVEGGALIFSLGCVAAAYRQRLSLVLAATFATRLATALAATAFALVHIHMPATNLCLKATMLIDGAPWSGCTRGWIGETQLGYLRDSSLQHWLWSLVILGGMGALHLIAVVMLLRGDTRRLKLTGFCIAGYAVAMLFLGAGALTLPPIYMAQIAAMVGMGFLLARIERNDIARRTRPEA
jgi:hypothetical protein